MNIVGCIITFESETTIGDTMKSITDFVDRVIVVDGSYKPFTKNIRSGDQTMTKVSSFTKPCALVGNSTGKHFVSEVFVRNQYLIDAFHMRDGKPKTDWIFVIDADEYIYSGLEETLRFLETAKGLAYKTNMFKRPAWADAVDQPLIPAGKKINIFRFVPGMHYEDNHHTMVYPGGVMIRNDDEHITEVPLKLIHQKERHTQKYKNDMNRYNEEFRPKVEKHL